MPDLIVQRPSARLLERAAATAVVVALRVDEPPGQIGIAAVHAGVDDGQPGPCAAGAPPGLREVLLTQVPLVDVVGRSMGVVVGERGIVRQVSERPGALHLDLLHRGVGPQIATRPSEALAGRRPHRHGAELGDRAHRRDAAAIDDGRDAALGRVQERHTLRLRDPRRNPRRAHQSDQVAGSRRAVTGGRTLLRAWRRAPPRLGRRRQRRTRARPVPYGACKHSKGRPARAARDSA